MSEITKEQLIEHIANMTVLELSELVKELEEKFGVKLPLQLLLLRLRQVVLVAARPQPKRRPNLTLFLMLLVRRRSM